MPLRGEDENAQAALVLVPLVVLAGYALALRVAQYGWTIERIDAAARVAVAACYAAGYAIAALRWRTRLAGIEATDIATALAVLAIVLALFTPVANAQCGGAYDALRAAPVRVVAPRFRDIEAGNNHLSIVTPCSDATPAVKAAQP